MSSSSGLLQTDSKVKPDSIPLKEYNNVESGSLHEKDINDIEEDNVFVQTEEGPDYRGVTQIGAAVLIAKSQLGLGVLGIPSTLEVLGFVPGLISLIGLCVLVTWTGLVIGDFRIAHPKVYSIDDATDILFGKAARETIAGAYWLFYTLSYGAAVLTVSIAFNTFSHHGMCTVGYVGIAASITFVLALFTRTMKVLSWCGYIAVLSIFMAIWVVAIACLTQSRPAAADDVEGPVSVIVQVAGTGSSYQSIASSVATQLFSLCGAASFFTIHAEMKDQHQYAKSLLMGQSFIVFNYIAIGSIMYAKVGQYIASPALGSAGELFQLIGYAIALPGLLFSCFFQAHLPAKYALVRVLRGSHHMQRNTMVHWLTWTGMMFIVIIVGFVIACAIPFFNDLLSLIGALFGSAFALIIPGLMCLYDMNYRHTGTAPQDLSWIFRSNGCWGSTGRNKIDVCFSFLCVAIGVYILCTGVYGSVANIADAYASGAISGAFSCDDNS
ncbi:unnamed protein product [Cyberlindnera jadinii]|uniref:Amino acid transporter transmembrane domain-containing protein n=1 Tax=Cyberlindnera jadinii (strain ATCC 18201 / CBS 1600 / BCRC 20928 / JCM 3617 / NBRC 0987 / NRRL Y-1542) TaxID=983966 RepID=A0A0H5C2C7_CYBJN|nr:hypothetical protein CYBJADRAFT_153097 [Cyberlindnera jadinii NRRL Y-1542]ODV72265.1 hypothetical protein CYBJADRAFT_153097 [Cyberlindnera jadinii NRRL Y-1542]CEP21921.1 unnamed protein product [Cyberlindnera jadinii]